MNTRQWLTKLIGFNTISSQSNLQLIEAIADWFQQHGIQSHLIHDETKTKANLLATLPTIDGRTQGGLVLSGHTDVVPVAGQIWDTDPFVATEKEGKIYGRGTCDMKGFIAILLALLPEFKTLNLIKPIHFSFTYDEEVGCIGVHTLLKYLQKIGIQPEACIVGEPSSMRPIVGEKLRQVFRCQIKGLSAHSSLPYRGCNAIEYASQLICYINKLAHSIQQEGPFDNDFDLPFSTVTTNVITGGSAANVIPGHCEFLFEVRYIPQFSVKNLCQQIENYIDETLLPEMRKSFPKAAIHLEQISAARGFNAKEEAAITQLVRRVTGIDEHYKVSYATEAGIFQDAHIPTVICGPGSIEQAHRPNEFVSIEQLESCEQSLRHIVNEFCVDFKTKRNLL